jgi:hypothetical protein
MMKNNGVPLRGMGVRRLDDLLKLTPVLPPPFKKQPGTLARLCRAVHSNLRPLQDDWSINGYIFGNMPVMTMKQGDRVRWYVATLADFNNAHTPHWHGNTVLVAGQRTDVLVVTSAQMVTADMVPDAPGIWFYHCRISDHMLAGMVARYEVKPRQGSRDSQKRAGWRTYAQFALVCGFSFFRINKRGRTSPYSEPQSSAECAQLRRRGSLAPPSSSASWPFH